MSHQLSPHFKRDEMACKCGCGFDTIDVETLQVAEKVREFVNGPVIILSAARCHAHNKEVHGSKNSQHVLGRALDLFVDDPKKVYAWLCDEYPGVYGFGLYSTFVHIDTRTDGPARW